MKSRTKDEDVAAVRKIFAMLADAVRDTKDRLQIIVFDHATDTYGAMLRA